MQAVILTIYPVLFLVFVFYGAVRSPKGETAPLFLRLEETRQIQAAAAIGVILHHVTQQITGYGTVWKGPVSIFNDIGFLFTALFFFFSGYGLMVSLAEKPDYLGTFPGKRLPAVLIPFWVTNLIAVLISLAYGTHMSGLRIVENALGLSLIGSNGWFIVEITVLYLLFYLCFSLIRQRDAALIVLTAAVVLLIFWSFGRGHDTGEKSSWFRGEWWYNSTITFALGLWYARFKKRLDAFFLRHHTLLVILFAAGTAALIALTRFAVRRYGYYVDGLIGRRFSAITLGVQTAACLVFTTFVLLLNMRVTIGNKALNYIAGIRMELFLIHGYFVNWAFGDVRMPDVLRYAVVLASSIACTALISPLTQRLIRKITALLTHRPEVRDTLESRQRAEKRAKMMKRIRAAVLILMAAGLLYVLWSYGSRYLLAESEYKKEMETLRAAETGDLVYFGRFETDGIRLGEERVRWLVIKKEDDRVCLLSELGLAGSVYHQKHAAVTWEDSDLKAYLASGPLARMFSKYEAEAIVPTDGALLTLLTPEEAEAAFATDEERELAISTAAEQSGTNVNRMSKHHNWDMKGYRSSWWWLKGESGRASITAPIVTVDGTIEKDTKVVNKPGGAVRPVVWVKTE